MLGFLGFNGKIMLAMGAVLAIGAGAFYWYFTWSQEQFRTYESNQVELRNGLETANSTIKDMTRRFERMNERMGELQKSQSQISQESAELEKLFSEHDLKNLIIAKPGLMEKRFNDGSAELGKSIEEITKPNFGNTDDTEN